jgi:hypothetical protein
MVRLGLTVTTHRPKHDDIDGRLFLIFVAGGPLGNINASDIRIQFSKYFSTIRRQLTIFFRQFGKSQKTFSFLICNKDNYFFLAELNYWYGNRYFG